MGRTRMAESGILIKGGEVVNEDGRQMADVYVEGRTIKAVGPNLEAGEGVRVIDATGKLVIPGGIDTHTHCQMPFMGMVAVDDFFIGTKAPHCLQPLERLGRREGVLRLQPSHGGHPLEEVEATATLRACVIAIQVKCPLYVVHVMSKSAAKVIMEKRKEGAVIMGEPIAASLGTDGSHYYNRCWRHAAAHVLSPPLREDPDTPRYLMELLANGSLQCTGTDNCTFTSRQKALGLNDFTKIPNGVNGLEDRMAVIWQRGVHTGMMTPERFVSVTSSTAARIFNIWPQKGLLAPGSDADIVVWNPNKTRVISASTHHHAVDFNIFEGQEVHGIAEWVLTGGRVVVEAEEVKVTKGAGRFIPNLPFSSYVYDRVKEEEEKKANMWVPVKRSAEDVFVDMGEPAAANQLAQAAQH